MRLAVRSLVVVTFACLLAAILAAMIVPIRYSATASGLAIYAIAVSLPAIGVFVWPDRVGLLGAWAAWNVFAGFAALLSRGPIEPVWVRLPLAGAVCLSIAGAIGMAFAVAAARQAQVDPTQRTRRIQSVVQLSCLIAALAIAASWIVIGPMTWEGALLLTMAIAVFMAPAPLVFRAPARAAAVTWTCWSLPLCSIYMLVWKATQEDVSFERGPKMLLGICGTLVVVVAVILPLVAFTGSGKAEIPEARVQ